MQSIIKNSFLHRLKLERKVFYLLMSIVTCKKPMVLRCLLRYLSRKEIIKFLKVQKNIYNVCLGVDDGFS